MQGRGIRELIWLVRMGGRGDDGGVEIVLQEGVQNREDTLGELGYDNRNIAIFLFQHSFSKFFRKGSYLVFLFLFFIISPLIYFEK